MTSRFAFLTEIFKKYWWAFVIVLCMILLSFPKKAPSNVNQPATFTKTKDTGEVVPLDRTYQNESASQEELQELYEGEVQYGNAQREFYAKYPWYVNIPIDTDMYFIVYDLEQESFRIRYKDGVNKSNPAILEQALTDIRNIGADPGKYYVINP